MTHAIAPIESEAAAGVAASDRADIAHGLGRLLADTYTLQLKTQNFHWNVTGRLFASLHLMFEQQYSELSLAVDLIAERIRALDHRAPGSFEEFTRLTSIHQSSASLRAEAMVQQLLESQEAIARTARQVIALAAKAGDQVTTDLATQRLHVHEKTAWMLRSLIE